METDKYITLYGPESPEWDFLTRVYHFTPELLTYMLTKYSASVREIDTLLGVNGIGVFAASGENWENIVVIPWKQAHKIIGWAYH